MTSASTTPRSRRGGPGHRLEVLRSERLAPHLLRVVLGGPGLAGIADTEHTDRYVKLAFRRPGVDYPEPLDVGAVRETMPREAWPVMRTYTVRSLDHGAGEMAIDFVTHGDTGVAGPWAEAARPGDELVVLGPGGAYAPAADVDAHLLVGDEAALPAIAAALERVAPGVPVHAFVEVDGPADEIALRTPGALELRWCHREAGDDVVTAVRAAPWPAGRVQAFVHGETGAVKELRAYLLDEAGGTERSGAAARDAGHCGTQRSGAAARDAGHCGTQRSGAAARNGAHRVERELLSISGYWRRGADEDTFQAEKRAAAT